MTALPADTLGRPLEDLRLSVIDRCNFRCGYCMPAESMKDKDPFLSRNEILGDDELEMAIMNAWSVRADQYSETRHVSGSWTPGPEMYRMGG